jgi:LacI family transcriptional regulator
MIAELSGVHVTTVSRVLNGADSQARHAAAPETVARIRALAAELGYRPNPHATSLRAGRSNLIGVLVPRLSDLVLATIYEGIEDRANQEGLSTFVTNSHDVPANQRARTQMMLDRRVDGLIFGDALRDGRFVDSIAQDGVPFVLVSRHAGDHPSVCCDDVAGGRLAAEHLMNLGHTDVAVIAGEPYASTGVDRTEGFVAAMAENGIQVPPSRILHSRFDADGGRAAAARILRMRRRPTAVFVVNDFAAIGMMGVLYTAGIRVPDDIAVVGYNDTPLARSVAPALTTIRSPMFEMGQQAVDMLVRVVGGEDGGQVRLTPTLQARGTTLAAAR